MKLWLIGMMGSGKTTAGRATASRINVPFFDTDEEIENASGLSVPQLWERDGEPAFRKIESDVVARLSDLDGWAVIATGGGVPLDPVNRKAMSGSGSVVWLRAESAVLDSRVGATGRPLLSGSSDPEGALQRLLDERAAVYDDAADVEIDVGVLEVTEVVDRLVDLWQR